MGLSYSPLLPSSQRSGQDLRAGTGVARAIWQIRQPLPLLAALLLGFEIVTMPAANALSRNIEHAADVFAGEHTNLGDAGVRAQARLASIDLSPLHPSPLVVWYFYTHPPSDQRIMDAARLAHLVR